LVLKYCSNCGSDQLQFVIPAGENYQRYVCDNCDTIHYNNPRIIVGCLPVYEDKIVICKRAIEPCLGKWNFTIDPGEESLEVSLFDLHEIPWGEIGFTSSVYAIEKYMESLNHRDFRTYVGRFVIDGPENRKDFL
jgi:hypothetical protein